MAARVPAARAHHNGGRPEMAPQSFTDAAHRWHRRGTRELMQHTGTDALLERRHELEELDVLLEDARAGRGRLVLVEGPAGIGKTRLLQSAADRARGREGVVLSARASALDRDFPPRPLRPPFHPPPRAPGDAPRAAPLRR